MNSALQTLAENVCLGLLGSLVFASIVVVGIGLFIMETAIDLTRRKQDEKEARELDIWNGLCPDCGWKETRTAEIKGAVVSILNWCSKCKKRVHGLCDRTGMHHCSVCGGNVT